MNPEPIPIHHIICQCHSTDHLVQFSADDPDEEDSVCYISVQLHPTHRWYERVWRALKYIFGYKCRYGHWDCTSLSQEEAQKLFVFLKNHTMVGKKHRSEPLQSLEMEVAKREYAAGLKHPPEALVSSRVLEP